MRDPGRDLVRVLFDVGVVRLNLCAAFVDNCRVRKDVLAIGLRLRQNLRMLLAIGLSHLLDFANALGVPVDALLVLLGACRGSIGILELQLTVLKSTEAFRKQHNKQKT